MKRLVIIYHDESIFHINEGQTWIWGTGDHPYIQPKSKGAGIMISDFIDQYNGFLWLTDREHHLASASDPNFPKTARAIMEYGASKDGYWTSEKFMSNVKDQSSYHRAFANDALLACMLLMG